MAQRTQQQMYGQWEDQETRAQLGMAYLVGTLGVGAILVLTFVLAMQGGWLANLPDTVRHIKLSNVASVPQVQLEDAFRGLVNHAEGIGASTTTMWQRGSEGVNHDRNAQGPASGHR
jgi:hypothetical protein